MPQKKAVVVNKHTLQLQTRLQQERQQQAELDLKQSEELKKQLENKVFTFPMKVDSNGQLYGSVSALDIARLLTKEGYAIEKKSIRLTQTIKAVGEYPATVVLKEGLAVRVVIKVQPEVTTPLNETPATPPQE